MKTKACLGLVFIFLMSSCLLAQEVPFIDTLHPPDEKDITESTLFKLTRMLSYSDTYLVVRIKDGLIVGYAPWDKINRRWTLFNLHGDYRGFIQAIVGQQFIKHQKVDIWYQYYTQYLFYFKDNIYRGVMIASLGGRPKTETLPQGELGGSLDLYPIGNIPLKPPSISIYIDPAKRPMGIDISIRYRLR
ncbi:MAG: hypothetical protein M1511_02055 [Deltaproteobacteria bacterium]|nr:hypothetical protein [Deltaproteobacteria bacterium]